jgi:TolB protein
VDIDGKNLKMITKRPWAQIDPAWMPGEEEVLYTDSPELMGDEICKINIKKGDIIRLTTNRFNDIQPSPLAGGSDIIYAANENGNYNIYIMDKFGRNPRNLTNDSSHNIMPRSSKSGKKIYFLSDKTGYLQIYSLELDTGESKQITSDDADKKDFAVYAD